MVVQQLLTPQPKAKGFLTLEVLVAAALIALTANLATVPSKAYLAQYQRLQVRTAAHRLAADLRSMQQKALFGLTNTDSFHVSTNGEGYYITTKEGNNTISFATLGCDGVYFAQAISNPLRYTAIGAPSATGSFVLKHRQNANFSCAITIQVASGRVDLNENS